MSGINFIPVNNWLFAPWQDNFVSVVNDNMADWDFSADAILEWKRLTNTVGVKKKRFDAVWAIVSTGIFTKVDEEELKIARKDYESGKNLVIDTSLRLFIGRYIRKNPKVTEAQKTALGITVPDEVKSVAKGTHGFHPGNDLSGKVREASHLGHLIQMTVGGEKSRAKPEGVKEIMIFVAVTEASVTKAPELSSFVFAGLTIAGLLKVSFKPDQEGKRAWFYGQFLYKGKPATYSDPTDIWDAIIM